MKKSIILRSLSIVLIISLCVGGFAGCKKKVVLTPAPKDENGFDIIKMPTSNNPVGVDAFVVGEELGYFKDAKIKIERVGVISADQIMPSLTTGNIDVGGGHIPRGIGAVQAGAKIKAIAANTHTTEEKTHMTFVTLENSPIKTPLDMIGKKVVIFARGGCPEYTPLEELKKLGVKDPKDKFEVVVVPSGKEEQTLRSGNADVAGLHMNPYQVKARGGLRILFTDYDIWSEEGGQAPYYMTDKFIQANPDLVKRFVGAVAKTNNWVNANNDKAKEIYAKKFNLKAENLSINYYEPDSIIKENTVKLWVDVLKGYGEIKKDLPVKNYYTNDYNPNFKK